MSDAFDIVVVGAGIAGLQAAAAAAKAGARVAHVMGDSGMLGGLVINVGALEGYSGGDMAGIDLAAMLFGSGSEAGVEAVMEDAVAVAIEAGTPVVRTAERTLRAAAVIVATGAALKMLAAPGVAERVNRGVSQCAWCDGPLYKGRDVVVVGGGDAAVQEAAHLVQTARHVTIVTRGDALRVHASTAALAGVTSDPRITIRLGTEVAAVTGDGRIETVRLREPATGAECEIAAQGLFVFIGLTPNSAILPAEATRDRAGALMTSDDLATSLPGVYAIGAVRSRYSGRLDDAMAEADRAVAAAVAHSGRHAESR